MELLLSLLRRYLLQGSSVTVDDGTDAAPTLQICFPGLSHQECILWDTQDN